MIRPDPTKPIDILGGGVVIAPPSQIKKGYGFLLGSLQDLNALPGMRGLGGPLKPPCPIRKGERNNTLFRHLMRQAVACDDLDALTDVARTFAENQFADAMPDTEIVKTAQSVWKYQAQNRNWVASHRPLRALDGLGGLARDHPDALALLTILREVHPPGAEFALALAMAKVLGWSAPRWRAARDKLRRDRWITCTHEGGCGRKDPPRYCLAAFRGWFVG